jgi:muramidase (phage lysozyme)
MNALALQLRDTLAASANLRAFLRMLRVGEGTTDEDGYRRHFGGELADSLADHPRKVVTKKLGAKTYRSSAFGAYQHLTQTWDECKAALDLPDFSPASQDVAAVFLIRRRKALEDVLAGRIEKAIIKCNREWASLPGSPYGQPVQTMAQALGDFNRYLALEDAGAAQVTAPVPAPQPTPEIAPEPQPRRSDPIPIDPINAPQGEAMSPFIAAALPAIIDIVPKLASMFSSGSPTSERNIKAAETVIGVAKQAIGARNEQELVEMAAEKENAEAIRQAIEEQWFKIDEAREKSVTAAREFNTAREQILDVRTLWSSGLTFIEFLSLALILMTFGGVVVALVWADISDDLKGAIVTIMLIGGFTGVREFWFGGSRLDEARKTEKAE